MYQDLLNKESMISFLVFVSSTLKLDVVGLISLCCLSHISLVNFYSKWVVGCRSQLEYVSLKADSVSFVLFIAKYVVSSCIYWSFSFIFVYSDVRRVWTSLTTLISLQLIYICDTFCLKPLVRTFVNMLSLLPLPIQIYPKLASNHSHIVIANILYTSCLNPVINTILFLFV